MYYGWVFRLDCYFACVLLVFGFVTVSWILVLEFGDFVVCGLDVFGV